MRNTGLKILGKLEENGELTLEQIGHILPKKHADHRDFYVFASLVSNGYVDDDMLVDDDKPDPNRHKEQLLARKYYVCSTAEKKAVYKNQTWLTCGDNSTLKGQVFALSGKGCLYLSEYREKRFDRIFTLSAGILVGILVAIVSAYFNAHMAA